jgi:hypothetical protein
LAGRSISFSSSFYVVTWVEGRPTRKLRLPTAGREVSSRSWTRLGRTTNRRPVRDGEVYVKSKKDEKEEQGKAHSDKTVERLSIRKADAPGATDL